MLYFIDVDPKVPGSAPFSSTGERVFLAFAIVVGLVSAPVQSSSRSLLARLAPPDKITQYFGLFAFSGKVTAFLAPLLVALVTTADAKPAPRHVGDRAVPDRRHRADAAGAHAARGRPSSDEACGLPMFRA